MAPTRYPCLPWVALVEDTVLFVLAWIAPEAVPSAPCFDARRPGDRAVAPVGGTMNGIRLGASNRADPVAEEAGLAGRRRGSALFGSVHRPVVRTGGSDTDRHGLDGVAAATPAQPARCGDHDDGIRTGERLRHRFQIRPGSALPEMSIVNLIELAARYRRAWSTRNPAAGPNQHRRRLEAALAGRISLAAPAILTATLRPALERRPEV